jgi:hypothetical protein
MGFLKNAFMLAVAVLFFSSCTSLKPTPSGFLKDYSNMEKKGSGLLIDENPAKSLKEYSSFIVDPVAIYLHPEVKDDVINQEKLTEFRDEFYNKLVAQLKENYQVTDQPGPGVLRIRAAITDFVPSTLLLNLHITSTFLLQPGTGGAAIEAEFTDSETDERVLAMIQSKKGSRIKYHKGFSKWGHAEDVLLHWSDWLLKTLEKAHAQAK